jgi:UDP-N-acetylglucosamine--N-acetylmuramyl-(pentapeptide) pyrophosphoryl-undecaprenol N-acetylglucosamine transferase
VPYPHATDDHQTKNAATLASHGAAVLIADAELDQQRFVDELFAVLSDSARRATMAAASRSLGRPDAAERVVALARQVATVPIIISKD